MTPEEYMYAVFKKNYYKEMDRQGYPEAKTLAKGVWKTSKGVVKQALIEKYVHVPELKKGDACSYKDKNGKFLPAKVTYVDMTIEPHSYEIVINENRYVTTERDRLIAF